MRSQRRVAEVEQRSGRDSNVLARWWVLGRSMEPTGLRYGIFVKQSVPDKDKPATSWENLH